MESMDTLSKIFGSASKVKMMRLFLFNPSESFDISEIISKTKVQRATARREVKKLEAIKLVKSRKRGRSAVWQLNEKFVYLKPLREFLVEMGPLKHSDILSRLKKGGQLKIVLASGIFINDFDSRVDLLVVGDKINKRAVESAMRKMESEIGKELRYAYFDTKDFEYRLGMYDKLLRDVLDYPYQTVLNKYGELA